MDILNRISEYADKEVKVQNLAHLIDADSLQKIHQKMNGKKATGIDGVDKEEYAANLEENLHNLIKRMKSQGYYPQDTRRVYIGKEGSNKKRPLGISCYEDKLVENRVAEILKAVYEPKFYNFSYGFRPQRNCHQAVAELCGHIQKGKINYVVEADIRSFFDRIDHDWMIQFLEHDIADSKFIEIIRRMLKAGVMEEGKRLEHESGSPQGNGASPILANVYLHYVLDMWFEIIMKRKSRGEAYLVRYADDYVCCFQYKEEAEDCYLQMKQRLERFGLEVAEEKTRILEFGRFAGRDRKKRGERKPETFDFLGFTFYCGKNRSGNFGVKVKSSRKKTSSKLKQLGMWLKKNRHIDIKEIIKRINMSLTGHYRYYGVTNNIRSLHKFRHQVIRRFYYWINRRSQKKSYTWSGFMMMLKYNPIVVPKIYINLSVVA